MKNIKVLLAGVLLLCGPIANADLINFTGEIEYHNDVVLINFTLFTDATNISIWTDSFDDGANFDPITALWTGAGSLLSQNDDNPTISPATQTYWDSGFQLASLAAGDYILSIASYANFASGTSLSDGFSYDGETPIGIDSWWNEGTGYYSVWFDGVDEASVSVPEPGTLALLGIGLFGMGLARRKRSV